MSQSPNTLQVPGALDIDNVSVTSNPAYKDG